jgi:hypothetical protein
MVLTRMFPLLAVLVVPTLHAQPAEPAPGVQALLDQGPPLTPPEPAVLPANATARADEGVRFVCPPLSLQDIQATMTAYMEALEIPPDLVVTSLRLDEGVLVYTLATPSLDTSTLDFRERPQFGIPDRQLLLPADGGIQRQVNTVSRKEILLALMQHGRLTEFSGAACSAEALEDHVEVRRNIVAWAEQLQWKWPSGRGATWNQRYWTYGTPVPGVALSEAVDDIFRHQDQYAFGCYTATKIAVVHGILDYYGRIKNQPDHVALVESRLLVDDEPLVDIEPGSMWSFEAGIAPSELVKPGKVLQIQYGVAPLNFVPGDWVYFLNPDPASRAIAGYEGSNAIYLGRGRFDDYYDDNNHGFTYVEKLDEVFQWRHGVFNRVTEAGLRVPLSEADLLLLGKTPAQGGLVMDLRVFPDFFPPVPRKVDATVAQQEPAPG